MIEFSQFSYSWSYEFAASTRDRIFGECSLVDVPDFFHPDNDFKNQALEPNKRTVLHALIEHCLEADVDWAMRKGDPEEVALHDLKDVLASNDVAFPETSKDVLLAVDESEDDRALVWARKLQKIFEQELIPSLAHEVFTIMFSDREAMRELNRHIASMVSQLEIDEHPDLLAKDGKVKRCTYWPTWLRNALMYRDKGRCAICLTDLSGVISSGGEYAIDHIVPLNIGGINDPTNLQILCRECNSTKGGNKFTTSRFQHVYWKLEKV